MASATLLVLTVFKPGDTSLFVRPKTGDGKKGSRCGVQERNLKPAMISRGRRVAKAKGGREYVFLARPMFLHPLTLSEVYDIKFAKPTHLFGLIIFGM